MRMSRRSRTGAARPSRNLFRDHPREALLVMALTAGGTAAFYAYTIYMQKFLANTSGFDRATASQIMTVALTVMLFIQPLAGPHVRPDRAQADDDLLRRRRDAVHLSDLRRARARRTSVADGLRAGHGGAGHRHRLHLDQRDHQSRDVPGRHPRARRRAALSRSPTRSSAAPRNMSRCTSRTSATSAGSTSTSRCSRRCR